MQIEFTTIKSLRLGLKKGLLGEVYPPIRAVAYKYDESEKSVIIRSYLDRKPRQNDYDIASLFSKKLDIKSKEECVFSDAPLSQLDPLDGLVYARKENEESKELYKSNFLENITQDPNIDDICVAIQIALLGCIYTDIRKIVFRFIKERKSILIRYYFDRCPIYADVRNATLVLDKTTQIFTKFKLEEKIIECSYSDAESSQLEFLSGIVYARKEYDIDGLL
ncbi:MAG: hypothetical protein H7A23_00320 [Leptospiraceae bacterium]|nr:hypothetical protein [Leptospiraceae bacterium]MCP5492974.1 hypothetical protein [Leptospiraceae bacterium]